jgi:hypothetical protein
MRMLRGNAPQLRSYYSAGYNEAMHSGCAGTRHSERSSFPIGQIEFQISLRVRPPQLAASLISNTRLAVNPLVHGGLCISHWPIFNLRVVLSAFDRSCPNLNLSVPNSFSVQTRFAELKFVKEHSVFIGPAPLRPFCAVSTIGCSDYSLRSFPLANRGGGSHMRPVRRGSMNTMDRVRRKENVSG